MKKDGQTTLQETKKQLGDGEFWSDGYFVSSVGNYTSDDEIANCVKDQSR